MEKNVQIKYFNLPDYLQWDLPELLHSILADELGFSMDISQIRYDCLATPHSNYLFKRVAGFSKLEFLYANMVRAGYLERNKALNLLEEPEQEGLPE